MNIELERLKGESPQEHYRRLLVSRTKLDVALRDAKRDAAAAEAERELERRRVRDRAKLGLNVQEEQ